MVAVVLSLQLLAAGEVCEAPPASFFRSWFAQCALTPLDEPCRLLDADDGQIFVAEREFDDHLVDVADFRDRGWFKGLAVGYWAAMAYESYHEDDEFTPRLNWSEDARLRVDFFRNGGRRAILVPKAQPFILFPLGSRERYMRAMGMLYVTRQGGVVSIAIRFDARRRMGSK